MDAKEILSQELAERGYDGLCGDECGCELDDLMPCDNYCGGCEAGYKRHMTQDDADEWDTPTWMGGWMMTTKKPSDDERFCEKDGG